MGESCLAVGDLNPLRERARLTVWNEVGDQVLSGGLLSGGVVKYDDTGPPIGEGRYQIFLYCSFSVTFEGMPRTGVVRFEYPDQDELSGTTTIEDLVGGAFTTYTSSDLESERQRIRADQ